MAFIGVDGGGSTLRVVVVDESMAVLARQSGETVNPSVVGQPEAASRIRDVVRQAIQQAGLRRSDIQAIALGIAGAPVSRARHWLLATGTAAVPGAVIVPLSDMEIALVGARGIRQGVLLLAGTGSIAYGINADGEVHQAGGMGYMLGDEGSGFWLGKEALRLTLLLHDGLIDMQTDLPGQVLATLGLNQPPDIVDWLYGPDRIPVREVAKLSRLVLTAAEAGDAAARVLIDDAARDLSHLAQTVMKRLAIAREELVFTGGLLESDNALSQRVCDRLGLAQRPAAKYSPVMGAALMAKQQLESG